MNNDIEILDQRNIELGKILFSLRQSINLDKMLGLNADSINKEGIGKRFFVHIQMLLIESIAINICKIFEPEKNYPLNSLPAILNFIKLSKINPTYSKPMDEFVLKYSAYGRNKSTYIESLEDICNNFYKKHKISLKRYDYIRDKVITHTEYQAQRSPLPSHQVMEEILVFSSDFYCMISRAFIDIESHPIHTDKRVSSSLYRLFEKMGFKNIKTEFEE